MAKKKREPTIVRPEDIDPHHDWTRPLISRLVSLDQPMELKTGMVFALETYCSASDGFSAARIEEEVILTPSGPKVISLYPAQELPIANPY